VAEDARDYAAHAKAPNTLKAYRIDWADFSEWCALHRLERQQDALALVSCKLQLR